MLEYLIEELKIVNLALFFLKVEKITFRIRSFEYDAPRPLIALSVVCTECKGRQYFCFLKQKRKK